MNPHLHHANTHILCLISICTKTIDFGTNRIGAIFPILLIIKQQLELGELLVTSLFPGARGKWLSTQ